MTGLLKRGLLTCCVAGLLLFLPRAASAQQLELTFDDGLVTLSARDVSVRQILDEWASRGRTVVVNADLVGDTRVSLQLDDVPERQAIEIVLSSVAGYVAAQRVDSPGPSMYYRIVVLPESQHPATAVASSTLDSSPPPVPSPADLRLPSQSTDPDANDPSEMDAGRAPGSKPSTAKIMPDAPAADPSEKLSDGRPEGAVPGLIVPAVPAAPGAAIAPGDVPPAPGQTEDVNGRDLRTQEKK